MKAFVGILLVMFATGVGLLTYIAAGGKVADIVGPEIAEMIPFDLAGGDDTGQAGTGLPVPEVTTGLSIEPDGDSAQSGSQQQSTQPQAQASADRPSAALQAPQSGDQQAAGISEPMTTAAGSQSIAETPSDGPFRLSLPLDCEYGKSCFIQFYPDHGGKAEGGAPFSDYRCGTLSFKGHRGVDFRLPSYRDMERGVDVVASAPGTVLAVRDGMPDAHYGLFGPEGMKGRALGNTIILEHRDGYRTYYGHLRRGSIRVEKGQQVARGEPIAQVGMSGQTIMPNVHLHVTKDKKIIDPFTGDPYQTQCGTSTAKTLWLPIVAADLGYSRTLILRLGFTSREMTKPAAEYDLIEYEKISKRAKQLWFNAYIAGIHAGDGYSIEILGPDGSVFFRGLDSFVEDASNQLITMGGEPRDEPLAPGVYIANFKYFKAAEQDGAEPEVLFDVERRVEVR